MKVLAFDVDGTLSEHGTAIPYHVSEKLRSLQEKGIQLAFISGKPANYLAGVARGMGLKNIMLIGENGCVIFDPKTMDETRLAERLDTVNDIELKIIEMFGNNIWLQPNRVALTVFPKNVKDVPKVGKIIREMAAPITEKVTIYEHVDAVDIIPVGIDKGAALRHLIKKLSLEKENIIAFGDSINDLPMFKEVGDVVIIGGKITFPSAKMFSTIDEALESERVQNFIHR